MGNQGGNTREPVPGCRASEQWFILRQSQLPGSGAPRDRILLTSLWGARGGSIPQRHLEKWCYPPSPVPSVAHHPPHLQAPLPVLPRFPVQPEHITCLFPFQEAQLHPEAFQPIRDGAHTLGWGTAQGRKGLRPSHCRPGRMEQPTVMLIVRQDENFCVRNVLFTGTVRTIRERISQIPASATPTYSLASFPPTSNHTPRNYP